MLNFIFKDALGLVPIYIIFTTYRELEERLSWHLDT